MKLMHISDCHLGGWRNEKLEELNFKAFEKTLDIAKEKNVNAILISGDLFDVPLPSLKIIVKVINKLREIRESGIKIYAISGSHDIASNVGVINLLEASNIIKNVDFRKSENIDYFIEDDLFIIGLSGKKRGKEVEEVKELVSFLNKNKEKFKDKKKILLVHSTIKELVSLPIESIKLEELPNYFDYYGFGHIHINKIIKKDGKIYAYPGPTFPNNFEEIEKLKHGYALIIDLNNKEVENLPIKVCEVENLHFNADGKNPFSITNEIVEKLEKINVKGKILTLRINGVLAEGSPGQIEFSRISEIVEKKGGILLRNTNKLHSKEFEIKDVDINLEENLEKIEKEFLNKFENKALIEELIRILDMEKKEGETNFNFEDRIINEIKKKEEKLIQLLK